MGKWKIECNRMVALENEESHGISENIQYLVR